MSRPRKRDKHLPKYVRVRNGSYLYKDAKLCRVEEGEAAMYAALAKRIRTFDLAMVPMAVAAYKLAYLPTLSASVQKEHGRLLDVFAREFDAFRVDQVEAADIRESVRNLYGNAPHSAKAYKSRISTFFGWAISEKRLTTVNPCREVRLSAPKSKRTRWTDAEFWRVHEGLDTMKQCYHLLSFLLYQRATDIRHLKRTDIREGVIHFAPSKVAKSSGAELDVPITPAIQAVLDRAAAISREWGIVCPWVIHTRQGTAYTATGIRSAYRRLSAPPPKSLLPYAMQAAERRGWSRRQLQVGRGHTSITTTEHYLATHTVPVSEVVQELPPRVLDNP